jgi:glutamate-5-semialdehyde dehydrogenase
MIQDTQDMDLPAMGRSAKEASAVLALLSTARKNALLLDLAAALENNAKAILQANAADVEEARQAELPASLLDRLLLNSKRLSDIARDVRAVSLLRDPVGDIPDGRRLDNGLTLLRRRVPLGVLAVIYEARPNVTVDVASLCLKTGNAVILRGGKETVRSNAALTRVIQDTLGAAGLPSASVQAITSPDRGLIDQLLRLDAYVDLVIPRGGAALHRLCRERSTIPVITGGIGVCHIIVDAGADLDRAIPLIENAKLQRPSACNAMETLLVLKAVAPAFIPRLAAAMAGHGSVMHASLEAMPYLDSSPAGSAIPVREGDYDQEWLCNDFNLHVVENLDQAFAHIRAHGTGHSDAILTADMEAARRFTDEVDSSSLYVNASTRFTDGGQFGLGAELAISTQKLHVRGPMALEALTTYKWIVQGDYSIRP